MLSSQVTRSCDVQGLQELDLHSNQLTGTLPATWGQAEAWSNLTTMAIFKNSLSGTIPASWAEAGAFPVMEELCALLGTADAGGPACC